MKPTSTRSAEIAVDKMTVVLSDGTFDGAVESENLTAFITGGRYASQPAEDYFDPDYIAAYRDGWFVPVESSALRAAPDGRAGRCAYVCGCARTRLGGYNDGCRNRR